MVWGNYKMHRCENAKKTMYKMQKIDAKNVTFIHHPPVCLIVSCCHCSDMAHMGDATNFNSRGVPVTSKSLLNSPARHLFTFCKLPYVVAVSMKDICMQ